jgi:GNAT superfamily N-acetyltransferase
MKIFVQNPDLVDLTELAAFTHSVRVREFATEGHSPRQIEAAITEQIDGKPALFITARVATKLVGWIVLLPVSRTTLQINLDYLIDGRPVVDPVCSQYSLEEQLIQAAKVWAQENGYQEIKGKLLYHGRVLAEDQNVRYQNLGFRPVFEYVGMECDLSNFELPDFSIPEAIRIGDLEQANESELRAMFVEAFRSGDAVFFQGLSDAEIDCFFDSLGYQDALEQKGSIILQRADNLLVGFSMVLAFETATRHISCMCIQPKFQGMGYGKLMLQVMLQRIRAEGVEKLTLGTEQAMRAYQLYANHGFGLTWGEAMYSMTVA